MGGPQTNTSAPLTLPSPPGRRGERVKRERHWSQPNSLATVFQQPLVSFRKIIFVYFLELVSLRYSNSYFMLDHKAGKLHAIN